MPLQSSTFNGDSEFSIRCTGDCVRGDIVRFERATFTGSYSNPKFAGFELVTGEIVADSYGRDKQQHTFTLLLASGEKLRIKGRNLYKNGTWRNSWADESSRKLATLEKHARGDSARADRQERRDDPEILSRRGSASNFRKEQNNFLNA